MKLPRLRSPIVLVHGLCGFSQITIGRHVWAEYFCGIPSAMQKSGNEVLTPWLSATRGTAERARQLKKYLDRRMPTEPVHIVAHSMGGLDARFMISKLGMADRVLSLTTLSTPHRGSSFADWGIRHWEGLLKPLLNLLWMPTQAFYDVTTSACRRFNKEVHDVPSVRYFSVSAEYDGHLARLEWQIPYHIVLKKEGPNDGVVSVRSATYGEHLETWRGDHLSMVNWRGLLWRKPCVDDRILSLFQRVLGRLTADGF